MCHCFMQRFQQEGHDDVKKQIHCIASAKRSIFTLFFSVKVILLVLLILQQWKKENVLVLMVFLMKFANCVSMQDIY